MGIDILLDSFFSPELLRVTLSKLLGLDELPGSVVVHHSPSIELPQTCKLFVIASKVHGQMRQLLELHFQHESSVSDFVNLVVDLCIELNCTSLMPDDDVNPYSRLEVRSDGEMSKVFLDVSVFNQESENIIKYG